MLTLPKTITPDGRPAPHTCWISSWKFNSHSALFSTTFHLRHLDPAASQLRFTTTQPSRQHPNKQKEIQGPTNSDSLRAAVPQLVVSLVKSASTAHVQHSKAKTTSTLTGPAQTNHQETSVHGLAGPHWTDTIRTILPKHPSYDKTRCCATDRLKKNSTRRMDLRHADRPKKNAPLKKSVKKKHTL